MQKVITSGLRNGLKGRHYMFYIYIIFDFAMAVIMFLFGICFYMSKGQASKFLSGYNMKSAEERKKYDEKKLCRTMGVGMSIIAILALIMGLLENILPAFFVYIALGIIVVDVVVIIILENTLCKK